MKFSTKTTYGLRALARLAKNYPANISLSTIAKKEKISGKYLERIFAILKKNNLVVAEKGMAGGYALAKEPQKVLVYDIIKTLEGGLSWFHCLNETGKVFCGAKCHCPAALVLKKIQASVWSTLEQITLRDLV